MSDIQKIAATVTALAAPGMKPKDLLTAVREKHPDASKKEIVRGAFYAAIEQAETDPHLATEIHGAALEQRSNGNDEANQKRATKRKSRK